MAIKTNQRDIFEKKEKREKRFLLEHYCVIVPFAEIIHLRKYIFSIYVYNEGNLYVYMNYAEIFVTFICQQICEM